jgi:FkbM family methyltransferase
MSERSLPFEPAPVRALARIVRALPIGRYVAMNWLAYWPSGPFWWRLPRDVGGFAFRCDLRDLLAREVCVTGRYEPQETILLRYLLGPGHTFVDVGANWGYFSLVAASFVGSTGRVVAVEPDPRACAALRANIARNGLETVAVVEAAADERDASVSLNTYGDDSNELSNYGVVMSTQVAPSGMRVFDVRTRPLDTVLDEAGVGHVDLLKMDVEGAEGRAIAGLSRRLARGDIERILIELHPAYLQERGESAAQVVAALREYGFHVSRVDHTPAMHRQAALGSVSLSSLLLPVAPGDDLGDWPHLLLTKKPL